MDFRTTTVAALAADVSAKRTSTRELVSAALDRIEEIDPRVNAFVALDGDRALAEAAALDARIAAGEDVGPLAGIPIGVKDLEDASGFRTTQGSAVYADSPIATADSPLVERLKAAGCIVLGKTNTPELGHKGDTVNPLFGATCNPWDLSRSAAVHRLGRRRLHPHPRLRLRHLGHEAVAGPSADGRDQATGLG
jgi:Asp-tRNA(Asn)/Glu-tRNA(Gln) amidotransferase A subunit family amidase